MNSDEAIKNNEISVVFKQKGRDELESRSQAFRKRSLIQVRTAVSSFTIVVALFSFCLIVCRASFC